MGFFTSEPSTVRLGANREQRKQCWESRDLFFDCLEKNNIIDATDKSKNLKVVKTKCSPQLKSFEKNCAESWVSYFKEKRIQDYKKQKFQEEMDKIGAKQISLTPQEFASMQKK